MSHAGSPAWPIAGRNCPRNRSDGRRTGSFGCLIQVDSGTGKGGFSLLRAERELVRSGREATGPASGRAGEESRVMAGEGGGEGKGKQQAENKNEDPEPPAARDGDGCRVMADFLSAIGPDRKSTRLNSSHIPLSRM